MKTNKTGQQISKAMIVLGESGDNHWTGLVRRLRTGCSAACVVMASVMLAVLSLILAVVIHAWMGISLNIASTLYAVLIPFVFGIGALTILLRVFSELVESRARLRQLFMQDPLTGILNHSTLMAVGERICRDARGARLAVVVLELDRLRQINEEQGRRMGDAALRLVAHQLEQNLPASGFCGRVGAEEFAVILPGTSEADATALAERLRACVQHHGREIQAVTIHASISVGVAVRRGLLLETVFEDAMQALKRARHAGGNRVCCSPELEEDRGLLPLMRFIHARDDSGTRWDSGQGLV